MTFTKLSLLIFCLALSTFVSKAIGTEACDNILENPITEIQRAMSRKQFLDKTIAAARSNYNFKDPAFLEVEAKIKALPVENTPLVSLRREHLNLIQQLEDKILEQDINKEKYQKTIKDRSGIFYELGRLFRSEETQKKDDKKVAKAYVKIAAIDEDITEKQNQIKSIKEKIEKLEARIKIINANTEQLKEELKNLKSTLPVADSKILALEAQARELEAYIQTLPPEQLPENKMDLSDLKAIIQNVRASHAESATLVDDFIFATWLRDMKIQRFVISLAIGNPFTPPTENEAQEIRALVQNILEAGIRIIYDADSMAAPLIRQLAGTAAVGVSGKSPHSAEDRIVHVENSYLRWLIFTKGHMISSFDSLVGLSGVFLKSDLKSEDNKDLRLALPRTKQIESYFVDLKEWNKEADKTNLGLEPIREVKRYRSFAKDTPTKPFPIPYFGTQKWDDLILSIGTNKFFRIFQKMSELILAKAEVQAPTSYQDHVVFFGSGSVEKNSASLVFDANTYLGSIGFSVAHGGSIGLMEVAGLGTLKGGGYSIGIPLKPGKLKSEIDIPTHSHTTTVFAPTGYDSRIPLLLKNRSWVVIGPGGSGTMKELAATLVSLNSSSDPIKGVVFLSKDYYGRLYDWIQKSELPKEIKNKFFIAGSVEELSKIIY